MKKKKWPFILAFIILSLSVTHVVFPSAFKQISKKFRQATGLDYPVVRWEMLHQYNYKTGEGPEDLLKLNGQVVRLPGFIVPLSDNYSVLQEFIVVPDAQSCIHVPPPPPNLIISVKLRKPISSREVSNPAWVTGVFKIKKSNSQYGGSAYKMDAFKTRRI